jgi:hypothetical protein
MIQLGSLSRYKFLSGCKQFGDADLGAFGDATFTRCYDPEEERAPRERALGNWVMGMAREVNQPGSAVDNARILRQSARCNRWSPASGAAYRVTLSTPHSHKSRR